MIMSKMTRTIMVCCQNNGSEKSLTRRQRHEEILAGQLDSFGDFL
jgi:hypothetical protein